MHDEKTTPAAFRRDPEGTHPSLDDEGYKSTRLRHPRQPLVYLPQTVTEASGPQLGLERVTGELDHDLTRQHEGEPLGERIVVSGRVLDGDGRPIRGTLVEIWQANAAGRYLHKGDQHRAPLDPNFTGAGRCVTDDDGRYEFITIKPGAYPWGNHHNAWRPQHIHFSLLGTAFAQRLVTQMYFPGDPLFQYDPIYNSVRDPKGRERMVSSFNIEKTVPDWALAYDFDVVLRGPESTPIEEEL
jgi:protocatechuate 3,4-dioxygenase beta subunit